MLVHEPRTHDGPQMPAGYCPFRTKGMMEVGTTEGLVVLHKSGIF